jgi:hypothetical protein
LVTATVCGNNFLNGSVDCLPSAAGQTNARPDGTFAIEMTVSVPPKPCPCVIRLATDADTNGVTLPFEVEGVPVAPPQQNLTSRNLDVSASLSGSGPLAAFFGGAAKRELVLTVTNSGSAPLAALPVTLTVGKGLDPTDPLLDANGQPIVIPDLAVGQVVEIRQPVTLPAPAFGQYRVKGTFSGLDFLSVDGERNNVGDLGFSTTTSTYPWGLIVIGWLLLQIPLLGLYKRRPVIVEPAPEEDPFADDVPVAAGAEFDGFAQGLFGAGAVPAAPPIPPPNGFVLVGAAGSAPVAPVVPTAPLGYGPSVPSTTSGVFGVDDLRSMLDPPRPGA